VHLAHEQMLGAGSYEDGPRPSHGGADKV